MIFINKNITKSTFVTVILAILCNVLWGSAYPGIKLGYEAFGIETIPQILLFAGIRFTFAGFILISFLSIKNKKIQVPKSENMSKIILLAFVYTTMQYFFFYLGLSKTTGTNGSIVNSTSTFMAIILAHFIYKDEKINLRKIIGSVLGFAGILIVTMSGWSSGVSFLGEGLIMIGALAFVIGSVISKKVTQYEDSTTVATYNLLFGGLFLVVIGLLTGGRFETVSMSGIAGLMYLSFISIAAYSIWTMLLTYNPVSKISIYNFIIPISATILSAIFLRENVFELKYFLSLVLVCAGIITVNLNIKKQ